MLRGNVFITGGAGFLARGILRRARRDGWDCSFTVYSRDEEKQRKLRSNYTGVRCVLGDITDISRLALAMIGHQVVIHTAALKYIPECEVNVSECLRVNILGTKAVMEAAVEAGVDTVVCVSTDKAPQPVNTYGMSKALVERLVHEGIPGNTGFNAVRYGNVIGSTGSVWPVWKEQALTDGRIQVTDPTMTRYMMGVDQAIDTILQAENSQSGGLVIIPRPKAVKMGSLAEAVAHRLGVPTHVVGPRPGEKTHEQMISPYELRRVMAYGDMEDYVALVPPHITIDSPQVGRKLLTSEDPAEWMSPDEFIALAEDSESV